LQSGVGLFCPAIEKECAKYSGEQAVGGSEFRIAVDGKTGKFGGLFLRDLGKYSLSGPGAQE